MNQELWQRAGQRLMHWKRTMILSHDRPDGDALGAIGAMKRVIEAQGRQAVGFVYADVPPRYRYLADSCGLERWQPGDAAAIDARFEGILIADTCSWSQLEPVAEYLRASALPKVIVDHHATRDELTGRGSADLYLIDATGASACALLHDWCRLMNWPIDAAAAEALLTGITTDTGWFRFSNTDPSTLHAAASLVESGVRPDLLYSRVYEAHSPARLRLLAEMLSTLEFHANGLLAVASLTRAMFVRAAAAQSDSEEMVNEAMSTGSVVVSVLFSETEDGRIRVNFRSKSPEVCGRDVDVAALARQFGGGGHHRAAGARFTGGLDEVRQRVIAAVVAALR